MNVAEIWDMTRSICVDCPIIFNIIYYYLYLIIINIPLKYQHVSTKLYYFSELTDLVKVLNFINE